VNCAEPLNTMFRLKTEKQIIYHSLQVIEKKQVGHFMSFLLCILVEQHCGKFCSPTYQIIVYSVYGM